MSNKGKKKRKKASIPAAKEASAPFVIPRHYYWILLGVVCLVGLYFRFKNLGYLSIWGDELFHIFAADNIIHKGEPLMLSGQYFTDAPLLTYLLSIFHRVFGVSEVTGRLLPVLFGLFTIPLVYWIGADLFQDKRVGLVAAAFIAVIPWYVIRAKVLRPYTAFQLTYLGFFYLFYKGFEATRSIWFQSETGILNSAGNYLKQEKINLVFLFSAFIVLFIGKKFQDLALQAAPTVFVYAVVIFLMDIKQTGFQQVKFNKYAWVVYCGVLGIILAPLLVPLVSMRSLKDLIGWENFINRLTTATFWAFKRYIADAIVALHPGMWVWGVVGIIITFFKRGRHTLYTLTFFLVPFLIQSFVFNNPNAVKPQYLFFIFPFFLLLSAYGIVQLAELVIPKMVKGATRTSKPVSAAIIIISLVFLLVPASRTNAFVSARKHGDLKDRSKERYANWREGCAFVKKHMQPTDLVISTQPWSVLYYLKKADYHIRMGFNKYEYLKADYKNFKNALKNPNQPLWPLRGILTGIPILKDYNNFRWTVERHQRGWLIACHKFFNRAFVDQRVQQYVMRNFKQAYIDKDRSIVVYYWNFNQPELNKPQFTIEKVDQDYIFNFPDPRGVQGSLWLQLDIENTNKTTFEQITINQNGPLQFRLINTTDRQIIEAKVSPQWLKAGANKITFKSISGVKYLIYHIGITMDRDHQFIRSII